MTPRAASIVLIPVVFAVLAAVTWRRAKRREGAPLLGFRRGLVAALLFTCAIGGCGLPSLTVFDPKLPVAPPSGPSCDSDDTPLGPEEHALNLLAYALPAALVLLVARRRRAPARAMPNLVPLRRVALATGAVVLALGAARFAASGVKPDAFTTYGALTPEHARGLRVRALLLQHGATRLRPVERGAPVDALVTHVRGSDCCGGLAHPPFDAENLGTIVWIGGRPALIQHAGERTTYHLADADAAERVSDARRPHFESPPDVSVTDANVFVDHRADGSTFVVRVGEPARQSDVGVFLVPPFWPLLALASALALALVTRRREDVTSLACVALLVFATSVAWQIDQRFL